MGPFYGLIKTDYYEINKIGLIKCVTSIDKALAVDPD